MSQDSKVRGIIVFGSAVEMRCSSYSDLDLFIIKDEMMLDLDYSHIQSELDIKLEELNKKEEELTMNNIFRFMESYGFAKNWIDWRDYYSTRNNTAHEYSIEKSRNLIKIIPDFIESVNFLLEKWDAM